MTVPETFSDGMLDAVLEMQVLCRAPRNLPSLRDTVLWLPEAIIVAQDAYLNGLTAMAYG